MEVTKFSTIEAETFDKTAGFLLLRDVTLESGSFLTSGLRVRVELIAEMSEVSVPIFDDIANTSFS